MMDPQSRFGGSNCDWQIPDRSLATQTDNPDVAQLVALIARRLERADEEMVEADEEHERELADDAEPRLQRDEAADALYAVMVETREVVVGLSGSTWVERLRLASRVLARRPLQLPRGSSAIAQISGEWKRPVRSPKTPWGQVFGGSRPPATLSGQVHSGDVTSRPLHPTEIQAHVVFEKRSFSCSGPFRGR